MGDRTTPAKAFGEVLRETRLAKGLTQDELADRANTERSHISSLERAEKGPSLGTILALASALGVEAGELVALVEARLRGKRR